MHTGHAGCLFLKELQTINAPYGGIINDTTFFCIEKVNNLPEQRIITAGNEHMFFALRILQYPFIDKLFRKCYFPADLNMWQSPFLSEFVNLLFIDLQVFR